MSRFFLFVFILLTICAPFCGAAEEVRDYHKYLADKKQELAAIKGQIEQERQNIQLEQNEEKVTAKYLQKLDRKLDITRKEMSVFDNNIGVVGKSIGDIQQRITYAETQIKDKESVIKEMLARQYMRRDDDYFRILFRSRDMGEFIRRYKFIKIIGKKNTEAIDAYRRMIETLDNDRQSLGDYKEELVNLKNDKKGQEKRFLGEQWEKHVTLKNIRNNISKRSRMIGELEKAAANLGKLMEKIEVAAQMSDKTASEAFGRSSGRFPWPVDSRNVVAKFGKFKHPKFRTVVINRGIHISATYGLPVYSVFGGVVKYADWFEGYGKMIIIQHGGGYYTIYCHLSDINVKEGDKVGIKQTIGAVGDSESFFGNELYFEMRKKSEPVDPLLYLSRV